uniref:rootletin n=1 Tax=Doryrhamphus excisus TaxID=161450 RepID=UPI0025AE6FC4|nr:rootletin [Doryrhamphus excisus]
MSSPREEKEISPALDVVIQKLEESLLDLEGHSGETLGSGAVSAPVSTLIRQIITCNLAEGESCEAAKMDDNQWESSSVTQTDLNESPVKQCSPTQKLSQMLMLSTPADADQESVYRQRLQVFREAQKRQAQLVQRLQTKVIQYKSRCGELEEKVLKKTSDLEKIELLMQAHQDSAQRQEQHLNTAVCSKAAQLEEEQRRCASLSQVNCVLREQLEQASTVNQGLAESLRKARQDAELCNMRLRREQETSSSRLSREQARVRTLWRQAASLRNTFTQLRGFADRTLSDMRGEVATASQHLHIACQTLQSKATQESASSGAETSPLERQLKVKLREAMQLQGRWDAEKVELNSRVVELVDTVQHLRSQNSEKDSTLSSMQTSLDMLETQRTEDKAMMEVLHAENQALKKMLCSVHQLVANESDGGASESGSSLWNNTLTALQCALSKHQKQAQDLHGRLDVALEQVDVLQGQLQKSDSAKRELAMRIQEVKKESQEAKNALDECLRESESSRSLLEIISSEKCRVEQRLVGVYQEADSLRADLETLRSSTLELHKQHDLVQQQREDAELQLTWQRVESQRGERSLEELEGKHSDLRKELITVKEALSRITLEKEVLLEDKASLALALGKMECHGAMQESVVTKLQNQEADLKDSLAKMAALSEGLAKDKVELSRLLLQAEAEKAQLSDQRREAEAERVSSQEEVSRLLQEKMNLFTEKKALESSHHHLQATCHKLKGDLDLLQKENARNLEQHSKVSRQIQSVSEELHESRKQLEVHTTVLKRASADKEEMAKDKAALEVRLGTAERKTCGLMQELLALRAEKQSLETGLFESQELSSSLEAECNRVDAERQSLLSANEALTRDVAQVHLDAECQLAYAAQERSNLEEKLAQAERNALQSLMNRDEHHREQLEAERRLKEQHCAELTEQQDQLRAQYEESVSRSQKEVQQAQEELHRVQQQCKQILLQAESDKQEALSQKEAEKAAMAEKMSGLQQDLDSATSELERTRREALTKQEQDKNEISIIRHEMQKLRDDFEASVNSHEVTEQGRLKQVRELSQQNQVAQHELEGLRVQLQNAEDRLSQGQRELTEARRALLESAQGQEKQRKEVLNLRRLLDDETREKEAIQASNQELRASIKRAESDNSSWNTSVSTLHLRRAVEEKEQKASILEECKSSMHQEASTLRSSMRELEKSRLQARRGLQELRRQVKVLEGEKSHQKQELQHMQAQLCQEEQKKKEACRQSFSLKQGLLESEAARDAAHSQVSALQRRVTELEEAERHCQELLQAREAQQRLSDQKHQEAAVKLQKALEVAAMQTGELSARLGHAEAAVQDLERQLGVCDGQRRDLEHKLSTLRSALRCTVGIDGGGRSRRRSMSPKRKHLQGGDSLTVFSMLSAENEELDLDSIQAGLLDLQRELRDTQRERDESKAQLVTLSQQLSEVQDKSGNELAKLQKSLKQLKEANREMTEQLRESHTSFSMCREEADREKRSLEEEVLQFRSALQASQAESKSLRDNLDLLQGSQSHLHSEHQRLKEALEEAQNRMGLLELGKRSLEGELQRARLRAAELEAEAGVLQERQTEVRKKLSESEDQCAALRVGKETLSTALARAERHQGQLTEQMSKLSGTLSNHQASEGRLQEQNGQLQRALMASEHDRRLLQDRLDKTQDFLSESKKLNHSLTERTQALQRAHKDSELRNSDLEKHNQTLHQSLKQQQQEADLVVRENADQLQDKVAHLQGSLHKLQREKANMEKVLTRLGKDKGALRKTLEKAEMERLRTEEAAAAAARETQQSGQALVGLERQLAERQDQVTALQAHISQLEHTHAQRLLEVTVRHHQELDAETEHLRSAQLQAEQALESREKAHRQRVKCLEDQVSTLKEQLDEETLRRQQAYVKHMLQSAVHSSM